MFLCRIFRRSVFAGILLFCAPVQAFADVCAPKFSEKLCVSENAASRICKPFPETYKQYRVEEQLYELFQNSPEMVQLGFCNVEKIKVLKDWHHKDADAYILANHMFISRSKLFEISNPDLDDPHLWRQYKWPIHHRGEAYYFTDSAEFKKKVKEPNGGKLEVSYHFAYIFLHELAHVIDLEPKFRLSESGGLFYCFTAHQILNHSAYQSRQGTIKGYDWLFSNQFRDGLDSSLHRELMGAPYGTFYGVIDELEDFAELFADYVLLEHFGINYTIEKNGEILFDRAEQFENENIQNKLAIVKQVLAWPRMSAAERQAFADDRTHCRGIFSPSAG